MDMKLAREFLYTHHNDEGNVISQGYIDGIMTLNGLRDCTVTEYGGTISIACGSLCGLNRLIYLCIDNEPEGTNLRLSIALQKGIVKFVG